jgi:diaminopimelate epimerase
MVYFNADGAEASMCGNGGRCISAFAQFLGIVENECTFDAVDGKHQAKLLSSHNQIVRVSLKMGDVSGVEQLNKDFVLDTGSPHYVSFVTISTRLTLYRKEKKSVSTVGLLNPVSMSILSPGKTTIVYIPAL